MGEKQSRTPLATPGAATTPFTFTHGKRGTEHLSEIAHGSAGELTVRSSHLARWAPPRGRTVLHKWRSRGGSARGEEKATREARGATLRLALYDHSIGASSRRSACLPPA